ncbi:MULTISPECIES: L-asparagine permease [Pantoea]|jgi:L-asparagine permease|uniref:L-asparagine permease n=2 Tax=Pantoea TaxID=53335 RepID=A0A8E1S0R1_9GAMM|nr:MULTISPECIES: L-asparagine permease [Pantoea]KAF0853207.1 L-asparagine permease [Pantoea dispersa 625]KTR91235.1 L-asparagine permease [Pantoea dispersa]KTR99419.1 L-asparagine permease [Pantoea dispersa]KTS18077.1 L-asparagine permease [Pantoea dispersa]KTS20060.1 L-asparagine permease [Pantoea dispersa]
MKSTKKTPAEQRAARRRWLNSHDTGYHKAMGNRQVQMIAIGGAIGTGLFLGAGARLQMAGPALALVYLVCGIFSFFILRALGELVLHRPSSGSFVSYAREFLGEKASYVAGWMYFVNWAMTGIVDITAVALYMHYWGAFGDVPQWVFALGALAIVGTMNMIGVKWFAEMEFWFALVKVLAIVVFLIVGVVFLGSGKPLDGNTTGFHLITDNGGLFPHGLLPALVLVQGVVFAFASIELVGTAAGECKDPKTMLPKAINSVIWRIGLFYVGSVVLLVLLLPWNAYQAGQSPFVTFFSKLGVPYIGSVMNIVVLSAALSSLNSGLYSTGRILRSMSMGGSAPQFMSKMSKQQVPYAGILVTIGVYVIGVVLNYYVPSQVFEIVLNVASLGIISSWAFIVVCQMRLRKAIKEGKAEDVSFKLPWAPVTSWLTLLFLVSVLVLMAFDYPNGTYTIASIPLIAVLLVLGWFGVRKRVQAEAMKEHEHHHDDQDDAAPKLAEDNAR